VEQRTSLGRELRWMRTRTGESGVKLAAKLKISQPFLSQIENGRRMPSVELVEQWHDLCLKLARTRIAEDDTLTIRQHRELVADAERMASDDYRRMLRALAEDANTDVVSNLTIYRRGLDKRQKELVDLDRQAIRIRHFQPLICPGPLQTPEYARLVLGGDPNVAEEVARAAVEARVRRGKRLRRPDAPDYQVIVTEHALEQKLTGLEPQSYPRLLRHVADMAQAPRITVRVIPAEVPHNDIPVSSFVLYDLRNGASIVSIETYSAQLTLSAPYDVRRHVEAWSRLEEIALDPDETIQWLLERSHEERIDSSALERFRSTHPHGAWSA